MLFDPSTPSMRKGRDGGEKNRKENNGGEKRIMKIVVTKSLPEVYRTPTAGTLHAHTNFSHLWTKVLLYSIIFPDPDCQPNVAPTTKCVCLTKKDELCKSTQFELCTLTQVCTPVGCVTPCPALPLLPAPAAAGGPPAPCHCVGDKVCDPRMFCDRDAGYCKAMPNICPDYPTVAPDTGCLCKHINHICLKGLTCNEASTTECTPPPPPCPAAPLLSPGACMCKESMTVCNKDEMCNPIAKSCTELPQTCPVPPLLVPAAGCVCKDSLCKAGEICQDDECLPIPAACPVFPTTAPVKGCYCPHLKQLCLENTVCNPGDSTATECQPLPSDCPTMPATSQAECFCSSAGKICSVGEMCDTRPGKNTCSPPPETCPALPLLSPDTGCVCKDSLCNHKDLCKEDGCHPPPTTCDTPPTTSPAGGCVCDHLNQVCPEDTICYLEDTTQCPALPPFCPPEPATADTAGCFCNSSSSICQEGEMCDSRPGRNKCSQPPPECPPMPQTTDGAISLHTTHLYT